MSGPIRRDASSDESNFVGATGGDPRVGRVDESNTQPPRRSLVSGPVGATRRTTAERVESTVELCRSDKSTGRYDSKTRVGPRRVASGRAWTWLMSRSPELSYFTVYRHGTADLQLYTQTIYNSAIYSTVLRTFSSSA